MVFATMKWDSGYQLGWLQEGISLSKFCRSMLLNWWQWRTSAGRSTQFPYAVDWSLWEQIPWLDGAGDWSNWCLYVLSLCYDGNHWESFCCCYWYPTHFHFFFKKRPESKSFSPIKRDFDTSFLGFLPFSWQASFNTVRCSKIVCNMTPGPGFQMEKKLLNELQVAVWVLAIFYSGKL